MNKEYWISLEEYASAFGICSLKLRQFFEHYQIVPVFDVNGISAIFVEDAFEIHDLVKTISSDIDQILQHGAKIQKSNGIEIWIDPKAKECKSYGVALRNIWRQLENTDTTGSYSASILGRSHISGMTKSIAANADLIMHRSSETNSISSTAFSRSVSYLGSKQPILDFVIEVISRYSNSNSKFLDLMCGSGVVGAATSRLLCTAYVSDALEFCSNIAISISNSLPNSEIPIIVDQLSQQYDKNVFTLNELLGDWLSREAELFVSDPNLVLKSYQEFVSNFPRYPKIVSDSWNPTSFVDDARLNVLKLPYGLITSYFANAYFGVRQSVDLDSIRYAIERINVDSTVKRHLLGVLIITASRMASNYGGHFAQPRFIDPNSITDRNIGRLFDLRARSVWHEFQFRLEVLSRKTEDNPRSLMTIAGPWQSALAEFDKLASEGGIVYVDPPYTREEASRYYHVLETLTQYSYPDSTGRGLAPKKGSNRFSSEFFTRSKERFSNSIVSLLTTALNSGHIVLWSFANNALCTVPEIVSKLEFEDLSIQSFFTWHQHRGQGKGKHRSVQEFIIAIRRK